jgi:hypothetical protein
MIPRGEVGLIFAQMGLSSGMFNEGRFAGVTLIVMVTALRPTPSLKSLQTARPAKRSLEPSDGIEDLVMEA